MGGSGGPRSGGNHRRRGVRSAPTSGGYAGGVPGVYRLRPQPSTEHAQRLETAWKSLSASADSRWHNRQEPWRQRRTPAFQGNLPSPRRAGATSTSGRTIYLEYLKTPMRMGRKHWKKSLLTLIHLLMCCQTYSRILCSVLGTPL